MFHFSPFTPISALEPRKKASKYIMLPLGRRNPSLSPHAAPSLLSIPTSSLRAPWQLRGQACKPSLPGPPGWFGNLKQFETMFS